MKFKKLLITALMGMSLSTSAWALEEGKDYEVLAKPVAQLQNDKIEVAEFFGYFCIHCKNLDPTLLKTMRQLPSDAYFRTEHVVWDENTHLNLARLTAAVNQAGVKYQANPLIFGAIFDKQIDLTNAETTEKWLAEQTAFDGKKVLAAYKSLSAQTQARKMADYTQEYNIQSTPTLVVGGKYKVLFGNGYEAGMKTVKELMDKVRQERKMPAPAPKAAKKAPKSKGSSFAIKAAH